MYEWWLNSSHPASPFLLEGTQLEKIMLGLVTKRLCESHNACGHCRSCKKTLKRFHSDWLHIEEVPDMEIIRSCLLFIKRKPLEGKLSYISIPNLGAANHHVQNALLKTLEEPSAHGILLIGTESLSTVLDTIQSRCFVFRHRVPELSNLDEEQQKIFDCISAGKDWDIFPQLEAVFKNRNDSKKLFDKLLIEASRKQYPGHWRNLALFLDEFRLEISRNIHPKIIWERAWNHSLQNGEVL